VPGIWRRSGPSRSPTRSPWRSGCCWPAGGACPVAPALDHRRRDHSVRSLGAWPSTSYCRAGSSSSPASEYCSSPPGSAAPSTPRSGRAGETIGGRWMSTPTSSWLHRRQLIDRHDHGLLPVGARGGGGQEPPVGVVHHPVRPGHLPVHDADGGWARRRPGGTGAQGPLTAGIRRLLDPVGNWYERRWMPPVPADRLPVMAGGPRSTVRPSGTGASGSKRRLGRPVIVRWAASPS
jgi:hypothetical protein